MVEYTIDDIRGRHVIDKTGKRIGQVNDLVFNPEQWSVESLLVELEDTVADDLHIEHGMFKSGTLAISRRRVESVGDNVLLNVNTDDIAGYLRQSDRT